MALARKLLVALWKYLETGTPPEGAVLTDWKLKLRGRKERPGLGLSSDQARRNQLRLREISLWETDLSDRTLGG